MLNKSGPDGREQREGAVAQLLALANPQAHQLLQSRLRRNEDPDGLRPTILEALQRHLLTARERQFGGAGDELRRQLIIGYLGACAPLWRDAPAVDGPGEAPVRAAARVALRRMPVRELAAAAETLLQAGNGEPRERADVLRCLADMQQTLLATTLAGSLEDPDTVVRSAAREALQLLTFAVPAIRSRAEFDAWHQRSGAVPYVQLAERAARSGPTRFARLQEQLVQLQIEAAREFVTVHVQAREGIDWAAVRERTISDGPAVLDACLRALQRQLVDSGVPQGGAAPRHQFCRVLLDRFATTSPTGGREVQQRRALLLEVAAYLVRSDEAEMAGEVRNLLLRQLEDPSATSPVAALRGLRRFPSDAARQALVGRASGLLASLPSAAGDQRGVRDGSAQQLQEIFDTLSSRSEPRWRAPAADAPDKQAWLGLVREGARGAEELGLRDRALLLAQMHDANEQRLPEAFDVVLELVRDAKLDTGFRSTCLVYLEAWRSEDALANRWLDALLQLLQDAEQAELRLRAAQSLLRVPESVDASRSQWFARSLKVLRERLLAEPEPRVLEVLVDCVEVLAREPDMPELAIGALNYVLGQVAPADQPVRDEHTFRLQPLLRALATVAADPKVEAGQWLAACAPLLQNQQRQSLRLVLQSQSAIDFAKRMAGSSSEELLRATRAMQLILDAAALREDDDWTLDDDLRTEARDVRAAFAALDYVDVALRRTSPRYRLLRVAVDYAGDKHQEVVQRVAQWLADSQSPEEEPYRDRLRYFGAASHMALNRPAQAVALLDARSSDAQNDARVLALTERVARALAERDPARALDLFERVVRQTSTDDQTFRTRLLDWMRLSLRQEPQNKQATLAEASQHAPLFEAADCPPKLKQAFEQLRSSN
ncbi:MAG: hypothetical protein AB8H80_09290 [Planctomycetota bacterium]